MAAIKVINKPITVMVTGMDIWTKRVGRNRIKQLGVLKVCSSTLGLLRHNMGLSRMNDEIEFHVTLFER